MTITKMALAVRDGENYKSGLTVVRDNKLSYYGHELCWFSREDSKLYINTDLVKTASTLKRVNACIELYMGVDWLKLRLKHGDLQFVCKNFDTVVGIDELELDDSGFVGVTTVYTYMREHG